MSGDQPPRFTLVTSKKKSSKKARSAVAAEGPEKMKSSGLSEGPTSKTETSGKTPGAGQSGGPGHRERRWQWR